MSKPILTITIIEVTEPEEVLRRRGLRLAKDGTPVCIKHPQYRGLRVPRCDCGACAFIHGYAKWKAEQVALGRIRRRPARRVRHTDLDL